MSKASINRAHDAFAELVKELAAEELSAFVAQNIGVVAAFGAGPSTGADGCADPSFLSLAPVHLHDEAALRLRSHLDERLTQAPSRSRGSKVQQHVLTWRIGVAACEVPVELEALADKSAVTLATSIDRAMRQTAARVAQMLPNGCEAWVAHVVVGDGVAANGRAARILWANARTRVVAEGRVRYFLCVIKCSTH